jgi:hypothetical protein
MQWWTDKLIFCTLRQGNKMIARSLNNLIQNLKHQNVGKVIPEFLETENFGGIMLLRRCGFFPNFSWSIFRYTYIKKNPLLQAVWRDLLKIFDNWILRFEKSYTYVTTCRRGAVGIASASGTEDQGSQPARVFGFREIIAMLLCTYHCL